MIASGPISTGNPMLSGPQWPMQVEVAFGKYIWENNECAIKLGISVKLL